MKMQFKRKFLPMIIVSGLLVVILYTCRSILKNSGTQIVPGFHRIIDLHVKQLQNFTGTNMNNRTHKNQQNERLHFFSENQELPLNHSEARMPLLTLFTTFKSAADRVHIHSNVIKNWALFQPFVRPVLYVTDTDQQLVTLAVSLGWQVLPCPGSNPYGTPFLKAMYQKTIDTFPSLFYGYSNGDILFDYSLLDTLKAVLQSSHELKKTLVIGQRTNFLLYNRTVFDPKHIQRLQQSEGALFQTDAEDYFFMLGRDFPWDKIPKLVVGRRGYDNYFVTKASEFGFSLVDATETLIALHQTGNDGNYAGHRPTKDSYYNYKLIGEGSDISKGVTVLALYKTVWKNHRVEIWHRITKADPRLFKLTSRTVGHIEYMENY